MSELALISHTDLDLSAASKIDRDDERATIKYVKHFSACNFDASTMFLTHLGHWFDQISDSSNIKCPRPSDRRKVISEKRKFRFVNGIDRNSIGRLFDGELLRFELHKSY